MLINFIYFFVFITCFASVGEFFNNFYLKNRSSHKDIYSIENIVSAIFIFGILTLFFNFFFPLGNNFIKVFFILLTIVGGSLISTSSGFKYTRIYILLKISYQEIYRFVKPINVIDKNLYNSETKIDDQDVKIAFLVFLAFIISIFILSSILTFDNLTFENSFKLSILTLTNTVSSALYGMDNLSFFDLNNFTKMSLILFMILGKIEIIAVIYLIKRFIFRE